MELVVSMETLACRYEHKSFFFWLSLKWHDLYSIITACVYFSSCCRAKHKNDAIPCLIPHVLLSDSSPLIYSDFLVFCLNILSSFNLVHSVGMRRNGY